MRALFSAVLSAILCLVPAGGGFAQQSLANPDNPSRAAEVSDSPCFRILAARTVVHTKVAHTREDVTRGLLIYKVTPDYPKAARKAHIQGTVFLCAAISKEGTIEDLIVASGPPELVPSSIKAVKKWRYKPYLLNGEPVGVETEIRVNYALNP